MTIFAVLVRRVRLEIAVAVDWLGHKLSIPGSLQFYLCQWVGREVLRSDSKKEAA